MGFLIITEEEQKNILKWIFKNEDNFIPNKVGKHRKFLPLLNDQTNQILELIFNIKSRILKLENINEYIQESFVGDLISFHSDGGYLHEHTDPSPDGMDHIRFNLFLSKPIFGGDPIYNGKILSFNERMYLKYNVKHKHSSLPVIGDKPRIAISYGILIDKK